MSDHNLDIRWSIEDLLYPVHQGWGMWRLIGIDPHGNKYEGRMDGSLMDPVIDEDKIFDVKLHPSDRNYVHNQLKEMFDGMSEVFSPKKGENSN